MKTYLVTLHVNGRTVTSRTQAMTEQGAIDAAFTRAMLDEWDRIKAAAKVVGCEQVGQEINLAPPLPES